METLIIFFLTTAAVAAVLIVSSLWRGYVLHVLWGWFMVPIFGLPALSVAGAIGVALIISFTTYQFVYSRDDRSEAVKAGSAIGITIIYPALVLAIGFIVKSFL